MSNIEAAASLYDLKSKWYLKAGVYIYCKKQIRIFNKNHNNIWLSSNLICFFTAEYKLFHAQIPTLKLRQAQSTLHTYAQPKVYFSADRDGILIMQGILVVFMVILVNVNPNPSSIQLNSDALLLNKRVPMTIPDSNKIIHTAKSRSHSPRPHSQGKSFSNIDEYLAHLRKMGAQDRPFYEKIGPNKYRLNTGRGSRRKPPQIFTRQQLLNKYGFSN